MEDAKKAWSSLGEPAILVGQCALDLLPAGIEEHVRAIAAEHGDGWRHQNGASRVARANWTCGARNKVLLGILSGPICAISAGVALKS